MVYASFGIGFTTGAAVVVGRADVVVVGAVVVGGRVVVVTAIVVNFVAVVVDEDEVGCAVATMVVANDVGVELDAAVAFPFPGRDTA